MAQAVRTTRRPRWRRTLPLPSPATQRFPPQKGRQHRREAGGRGEAVCEGAGVGRTALVGFRSKPATPVARALSVPRRGRPVSVRQHSLPWARRQRTRCGRTPAPVQRPPCSAVRAPWRRGSRRDPVQPVVVPTRGKKRQMSVTTAVKKCPAETESARVRMETVPLPTPGHRWTVVPLSLSGRFAA